MTPQPKIIPTDHVSGLFPGLANSAGPVGYRVIDSTALAEGQHTLAWIVSDSLGAAAGIGSRYFTVANSADAQPPVQGGAESGRRTESLSATPDNSSPLARQRPDGTVRLDLADDGGSRTIALKAMERLELTLDDGRTPCAGTWAGYLEDNGTLEPLPVGATMDPAGIFYWQPGPGFSGAFDLIFIRTACDGGNTKVRVRVTLA